MSKHLFATLALCVLAFGIIPACSDAEAAAPASGYFTKHGGAHYFTGAVSVDGAVSAIGGVIVTPPAAQTIAAGDTVAADACGGLKIITAAGAVTTDTTNTITAAATSNAGCCMDVVNTGSNAITLDANTLFVSAGAADVVLGTGDSARVCSSGSKWYQVAGTGNN